MKPEKVTAIFTLANRLEMQDLVLPFITDKYTLCWRRNAAGGIVIWISDNGHCY